MTYVHPTAIVDAGAQLGEDVTVWHFTHIRDSAILESGVSVGQNVYVDSDVHIGQGTRIQNNVSVYHGVNVGRWCFVGPSVVFTNDATPRVGNISWEVLETHLELGCAIGAGAVLRCGIRIGAFAMVGAGAIVTHSIPPFHLAVGLPARPTRLICACGQTNLPLGSDKSRLIGDCCMRMMDPRILAEAREWLAASEFDPAHLPAATPVEA